MFSHIQSSHKPSEYSPLLQMRPMQKSALPEVVQLVKGKAIAAHWYSWTGPQATCKVGSCMEGLRILLCYLRSWANGIVQKLPETLSLFRCSLVLAGFYYTGLTFLVVLPSSHFEGRGSWLSSKSTWGAPGWLSRLSVQFFDFCSGHDLVVHEFEPCLRLSANGAEPAWVSLSLPRTLAVSQNK